MTKASDHAKNAPRKPRGRGGGQFVSKGGPRAAAADSPEVDLSSTSDLVAESSAHGKRNSAGWPRRTGDWMGEVDVMFPNLQIGEVGFTAPTELRPQVKKIIDLADSFFGGNTIMSRLTTRINEKTASGEITKPGQVLSEVENWTKNEVDEFIKNLEGIAPFRNSWEAINRIAGVGPHQPEDDPSIFISPRYESVGATTNTEIRTDHFLSRTKGVVGFAMFMVDSEPVAPWEQESHTKNGEYARNIETVIVDVGVPTDAEIWDRWDNEHAIEWSKTYQSDPWW